MFQPLTDSALLPLAPPEGAPPRSARESELCCEISRRRAVEAALAKANRRLRMLTRRFDRMQQELRSLTHETLTMQEEERKTISRELHDEIAQHLASVELHLASLQPLDGADDPEFHQRIQATHELVRKSADTVHRFARELRPAVLDDLGLIPALRAITGSLGRRYGFQIHFHADPRVETTACVLRTVLYRVAQEALTNIGRHAHATEVSLSLTCTKTTVQLTVADNGVGFTLPSPERPGTAPRLGLLGMRERVLMAWGRFAITSAVGQGTTIRVRLPWVAAERRAVG